jgi:hypothetical protein
MLIKLKANIPEIFFGILIAVAIFVMGIAFESSRHQPANSQTANATNNGGNPVIAENGIKLTDWLLVGLNFFLVCSTLMLWNANNRSARIAERALTELERPFVAFVVITTALARRRLLHPKDAGRPLGVIIIQDEIVFTLANHGRLAAILLGREDRLRICDLNCLPPPLTSADIKETLPYGVIIAPQTQSPDTSRRAIPREVFPADKDQWHDLEWGGKDLILMGIIRYRSALEIRDIYEMKFCAVFDPITERFLMRGGEEYNSHKKI